MSWDCGCGDGWTIVLVGLLGLKAGYVAMAGHFLGWNHVVLLASLADFAGALIGWLL